MNCLQVPPPKIRGVRRGYKNTAVGAVFLDWIGNPDKKDLSARLILCVELNIELCKNDDATNLF